jgi:15-cis-phytoene synthase
MPSLTTDLIEQAARVDPDRTLATSFLEAPERGRVISLILFAHEIARARASVSEPGLAAIRLQWWRDVITQIETGKIVRAQPVAVALSQTVNEVALPCSYLFAMIDAHERELADTPFTTWHDIDLYLDETHGNLSRLSALACGMPAITTKANAIATHSAIAWGLARLLAATPQWCTRRSSWLPDDTRSGLDLEALYSGEVSAKAVTVFKSVLPRIKAASAAANTALSQAKVGTAFPVFAHTTLATAYAKNHQPSIGRGWARPRDVSLLRRQLALTWAVACQRL